MIRKVTDLNLENHLAVILVALMLAVGHFSALSHLDIEARHNPSLVNLQHDPLNTSHLVGRSRTVLVRCQGSHNRYNDHGCYSELSDLRLWPC